MVIFAIAILVYQRLPSMQKHPPELDRKAERRTTVGYFAHQLAMFTPKRRPIPLIYHLYPYG